MDRYKEARIVRDFDVSALQEAIARAFGGGK